MEFKRRNASGFTKCQTQVSGAIPWRIDRSISFGFATFYTSRREGTIVKRTVILTLLATVLSTAAFAQFPQMKRAEERRQVMIAADEERQRAEKENKPVPVLPRPVMNVDVQMTLSEGDYKTFAEAKQHAAIRISDGDTAWLYVKLNGKLERFVHKVTTPNGGERYLLYVEYGPQGDITAKSHQTIEFRKDELAQTEFKFSLSPGKAGHNKTLPIFFKNVAASRPGLWNNEIRVTDIPAFPRSPNDYLAKVGFTCDFSKGIARYPAEKEAFRSMVLRDTTDETKLPLPGTFDDPAVRSALLTRLKSEGVEPLKLYFSDDFWLEYSDLPTFTRQFRTVTATFLYNKDGSCMYGTADITEPYEAMNNGFGDAKIELKKEIAVPCSEFK